MLISSPHAGPANHGQQWGLDGRRDTRAELDDIWGMQLDGTARGSFPSLAMTGRPIWPFGLCRDYRTDRGHLRPDPVLRMVQEHEHVFIQVFPELAGAHVHSNTAAQQQSVGNAASPTAMLTGQQRATLAGQAPLISNLI
jgi:hypothetical protein